MLTLPVEPGYSMGSFRIGMPISEAIQHLKHLDDKPNAVEILYNEKDPLNNDTIVKIVEEDIVLYFESKTQRLKLIQINNVKKVKLSYGASIFSGPNVDASFVNIYNVFGPTYPGEFDTKSNTYKLTYPGLTFVFPIPPMFSHLYSDGKELPIEFPNNTTPIATTIYLFHGHDLAKPKLPPVKSESTPDSYYEPIIVNLGRGIELSYSKKKIKFGYSTQDVLMILGAPDKIYYKRNDKLRIHAIGAGQSQTVGNDYFYNYFSMGFDIMFGGNTHTVQKIMLHTNFPGSVDFNTYSKCNFSIPVSQFEFQEKRENQFIGPDEKFSNVQKILDGTPCSKPIVHDHTKANNPFGGTKFFAFRNCIFEVISRNDHINSLTLFKDENS
ncbi:predicted protein [Naegleria gruberi]|uniref:Predicted protein n=1 Tax=Naegleria gruberi TaxID=5762 RepID=D2VIS4_NAEGR|nr:uncharacterized protein NAEGRDRAFT_37016 [Naegleria gruberi]EFC43326.1 predicted protein [Naegleria gruberi]|eukprot:XP_002676070.1 predicted protein [Naegleria gruberi strain NEG-M]